MGIIKVSGMKCQHCVGATQKAIEAIPGVTNVTVDLDKGEASFDGEVSSEDVKSAVKKVGFEVVE